MANTDKNIVITPNTGASGNPKIVFSGADSTTSARDISLTVYPENGGLISVEGSAGQLFSVTNSVSGTIFSVNDVSGIPSIEVLDTGLIKLAQYGGNVLIGTDVDNGVDKLQVAGGISMSGVTLIGNTTVSGAMELPAGTALLPSLTTTDDTNTGLYFPAADTVAITTGGVAVLKCESSGLTTLNNTAKTATSQLGIMSVSAQIYIGQSNGSMLGIAANSGGFVAQSAAYPMSVGTRLTQPLLFATTDIERMRIVAAGNVLIGTTTDDGVNKLQVSGSGKFGTTYPINIGTGFSSTVGNIIQFTRNSANYIEVADGGQLLFGHYGAAFTERMRITESGVISIGTASPTPNTKLDVWQSTLTNTYSTSSTSAAIPDCVLGLSYRGATPNMPVLINFYDVPSTSGWYAGTSGSTAGTYGSFIIGQRTGSTAYSERLRITNSGNLLIGSAVEYGVNKIQVAGDACVYSGGNTKLLVVNTVETVGQMSRIGFQTSASGAPASSNTVASIFGVVVNTDNTTALKGMLQFHTNSGDSVTEKMRLTSGGNLLIGSTSDFGFSLNTDRGMRVQGAAALTGATGTGIEMRYGAVNPVGEIFCYDRSNSLSKALSLNAPGGNVLLGTISDDNTNKLQVLGSVSISGSTSITGTLNLSAAQNNHQDTLGISAGVVAIDCSLSNVFSIPLSANITDFTMANIPAVGTFYSVLLEFSANGTGYTIAWTKFKTAVGADSAVRWSAGTAPTLTSTNGKKNSFVFYTFDAGTTWIGATIGTNL